MQNRRFCGNLLTPGCGRGEADSATWGKVSHTGQNELSRIDFAHFAKKIITNTL